MKFVQSFADKMTRAGEGGGLGGKILMIKQIMFNEPTPLPFFIHIYLVGRAGHISYFFQAIK